jgi:hypothetical protein
MATISSDIRQYFPGIGDGARMKSIRISTNQHVHELTPGIGRLVILAAGRVEPFLHGIDAAGLKISYYYYKIDDGLSAGLVDAKTMTTRLVAPNRFRDQYSKSYTT